MPDLLAEATVRTAIALAAGKVGVAGAVSVTAVALASSAMRSMSMAMMQRIALAFAALSIAIGMGLAGNNARSDAPATVPADGAVQPPPVGHQASWFPARLGSRRHLHDQPAVVLAEIAVDIESALDGLRIAEPGPVQAYQADLDREATEHVEVGLGDGPQPDLGRVTCHAYPFLIPRPAVPKASRLHVSAARQPRSGPA